MSSATSASKLCYCIKAAFEPIDKNLPAEWSICYNRQQHLLVLSVQFSAVQSPSSESPPVAGCLQSPINIDGLNELIEFLAQVKMQMGSAG